MQRMFNLDTTWSFRNRPLYLLRSAHWAREPIVQHAVALLPFNVCSVLHVETFLGKLQVDECHAECFTGTGSTVSEQK
jgi:hypothetical protein